MKSVNKQTLLLFIFIILKLVFQYTLIHPEYELQRDEYLHLDQANHLACGYLSVPPLTSWISFIIKIFGNSEFWVKFFPGLFGVVTMVFVGLAVKALNGNLYAFVLSLTCVFFSALLRLNLLYQPNAMDVLSWTALYYTIIRYIGSKENKWLFWTAAAFAIGFLNKYNIAFLMFGLFPALLITRQREVLREKQFYLALVLGFFLILPNLIWQYSNNFPVLHHMQELAEKHLVHVERSEFFKSQIMYFMGGLPVLMAALFALFFYKPFSSYRIFVFAFIFTLIAFVFFKAKGYYAIGLYPIYFAFGAVYLSQILSKGWYKYLKPLFIVLPIVSFIPMYLYFFPNKNPESIIQQSDIYRELGLLRWEDGKDHTLPQDFADMLGWKELAEKVDNAYINMPDRQSTLVLCDNYGQAGAINYYTKHRIKAVSFNADYINWFDFEPTYRHLIRVKDQGRYEKEISQTAPYFENSLLSDSISNIHARELGTTIISFINARVSINEAIKAEIEEKKSIDSK